MDGLNFRESLWIFHYLKTEPLRYFFMGNSISLFGWGCFAILSIVFSIEILNAGAKGFGLIDGAYGMRALLSTFIAIWITTKLSRKKNR